MKYFLCPLLTRNKNAQVEQEKGLGCPARKAVQAASTSPSRALTVLLPRPQNIQQHGPWGPASRREIDLIQHYGFKCRLYPKDSKTGVSSLDISTELQAYKANCLPNIFMRMSEKFLTLKLPQTESSVFPSKSCFFSNLFHLNECHHHPLSYQSQPLEVVRPQLLCFSHTSIQPIDTS